MDRTGGYVRLALAAPAVRVADCAYNTQRMIQTVRRAASCGVDILLFPVFRLQGVAVRLFLLRIRCFRQSARTYLHCVLALLIVSC